MNVSPLNSDQIRLLTELGFVAAGNRQLSRAEDIFRALVHLCPRRTFPYVGWALAHMNAGHPQEAVLLLDLARTVVADADTTEMVEVETFRGFALQLACRNSEGRRALQWAAERYGSGSSGRFARVLLGLEPGA